MTGNFRDNVLNDRHRALGSDLDPSWSWNGMIIPQFYRTDAQDETVAVRTRAGLFDVSMLRIVHVSGPDSLALLNWLVTADLTKVKPGASLITTIVDEGGGLVDDLLIYVDGPDAFRLSHGGGTTEAVLAQFCPGRDVRWAPDDDMYILSLQGPAALGVLAPHTDMDLPALGYFHHQRTRLFGRDVSLARGGYSGERGYEVFCTSADAPLLWDSIVESGRPHGVIPVSWACLDIVRLESALLFYPFDMPHPDTTPWETRQAWAVDLDKPDFRGKQALVDRRGQERTLNVGLEILHDAAVEPGSPLVTQGEAVGLVNSVAWSRYLMKSLALGAVRPDLAVIGTAFDVHSGGEIYRASVVQTPFYDPLRLRTHPDRPSSSRR